MPTNVAPLASECLALLQREEAVLHKLRTTLLDIRAALLRHDMEALGEAVTRQAEDVRIVDEMRQLRETFQREAAQSVGVPAADVTLRMLAAQAGGEDGEKLLLGRERLRKLQAEVERLNRENAGVVRHGLDFLQHVLVAITGGTANGGYGPTGSARASVCGSLLKARG